jgi:hypothetical protein
MLLERVLDALPVHLHRTDPRTAGAQAAASALPRAAPRGSVAWKHRGSQVGASGLGFAPAAQEGGNEMEKGRRGREIEVVTRRGAERERGRGRA